MASEQGAGVDARQQQQSVEWFKYSKRVVLRSIVCREDKGLGLVGDRVVVGGWVRSRKEKAGKDVSVPRVPILQAPTAGQEGTCCEVLVTRVPILRLIKRILMVKGGAPDQRPAAEPAKSEPVVAYLRINDGSCVADLQVASVTRIRNILSYGTHRFFQNNGFLYVHMPIITTTDSRVCSKMFHVTTLFSKSDDMEKLMTTDDRERINLEVVQAAIREKSSRIEELKRSDSNREALLDAQRDLQKANELALQLEKRQKSTLLRVKEVNFTNDFFSRPAYLSFSTRLHLESYACALSSVYTFGPVFQADDSQSPRHLAEMWMVEVELAFAELEDAINCVEDYLKFLCHSILENCSKDIKFMSKHMDKDCIDRLKSVGSSSFARITYAEALEILKQVKDQTFETKVEQGLSEEHESYLVDKIYKRPVIIYEHPKEVKPFYMHVRDDGKTVSSFDIIVPKAGVLLRGSQMEERIDMITHSDTTVARMLVGNKCDLANIREVSVEEGKSLAEAEGLFFIETSALDSTNVKTAFEIVIKEIYNNVSRKVLKSDSYKAELSLNTVSITGDGPDESKQTTRKFSCC
ncbi:asparagine--tRNA ligase, cytoplasmic 2 [Cocos nucifera]|uniref:Asparagine--tRNA ligase, cytoplasmic 2 n=1 Tax=Cocos nucifera TaxID=13894 RepID=A0A8K0HYX8_COCNU|nr:asparagine--tRNA ligase, cytoplasmic 2 [Cocos nucifera]